MTKYTPDGVHPRPYGIDPKTGLARAAESKTVNIHVDTLHALLAALHDISTGKCIGTEAVSRAQTALDMLKAKVVQDIIGGPADSPLAMQPYCSHIVRDVGTNPPGSAKPLPQ